MSRPDRILVVDDDPGILDLPMLLLTARDAVEDRVRGLRLGADDYVTKPFSVVEVVARPGAVGAEPDEGTLRVADLELNEVVHSVTRAGAAVQLSPTEFRLLHYLLQNSGH